MLPKGAAFLYTQKEKQSLLKPFLINWGRDEFLSDSAFIDEFEYQGTRDITAFLCVPFAISFHENHSGIHKRRNFWSNSVYQKQFGTNTENKPNC